jgi:hypothetical protein
MRVILCSRCGHECKGAPNLGRLLRLCLRCWRVTINAKKEAK